jgi:hypothetical protein
MGLGRLGAFIVAALIEWLQPLGELHFGLGRHQRQTA